MAWTKVRVAGSRQPYRFWAEGKGPRPGATLDDIARQMGVSRAAVDRMIVGEVTLDDDETRLRAETVFRDELESQELSVRRRMDPSIDHFLNGPEFTDALNRTLEQNAESSDVVIEVPTGAVQLSSEEAKSAVEEPRATIELTGTARLEVRSSAEFQFVGFSTKHEHDARDLQRKVDNILDMSTWWMPQRVVKEIIGDFQEDIHRRILAGQRVCVWGETLMTLFWLTTNTIGYFLRAVGVRKAN